MTIAEHCQLPCEVTHAKCVALHCVSALAHYQLTQQLCMPFKQKLIMHWHCKTPRKMENPSVFEYYVDDFFSDIDVSHLILYNTVLAKAWQRRAVSCTGFMQLLKLRLLKSPTYMFIKSQYNYCFSITGPIIDYVSYPTNYCQRLYRMDTIIQCFGPLCLFFYNVQTFLITHMSCM